jgi:hypothetical protein
MAALDLKAMREALIDSAAEKRGIEIGMCLAASIVARDFDRPTIAEEILGAAGIDRERLLDLELDDYDAEPLLELLEATDGR